MSSDQPSKPEQQLNDVLNPSTISEALDALAKAESEAEASELAAKLQEHLLNVSKISEESTKPPTTKPQREKKRSQQTQSKPTPRYEIVETTVKPDDESKDNELKKKDHAFWFTQPVPASPQEMAKDFSAARPIENKEEKISKLSLEPLPIHESFEWFDLDETDSDQMEELYELLADNYVADSEAYFQFAYEKESIRWAINVPGTFSDWKLGVRTKDKKILVAFVSAVPTKVQAKGKIVEAVVIDFLCVHKSLRDKRLAPLLIKEITRRVNIKGIFSAVFTGLSVIVVLLYPFFLSFFSRNQTPNALHHRPLLSSSNQPSQISECEIHIHPKADEHRAIEEALSSE